MLSFFWQFEKFGTGGPSLVRNMRAVQKTGFCGTEGIFGTGNPLLRYGVHLHSEALGTGNALLLYRMGFRGASMGSVFVLGECLR